MRTGVVNANLVELKDEARLPYIADLIARKQSGENTTLEDADVTFHQREYERLRVELQAAHDASQLSDLPSEETRRRLNDLLVRIRIAKSSTPNAFRCPASWLTTRTADKELDDRDKQ
jgi:predicted nucleotidyltransferase